jgi:hypothetical protein
MPADGMLAAIPGDFGTSRQQLSRHVISMVVTSRCQLMAPKAAVARNGPLPLLGGADIIASPSQMGGCNQIKLSQKGHRSERALVSLVTILSRSVGLRGTNSGGETSLSTTVRPVAVESNNDALREQRPTASTNWWLVVVMVVFSIAGLVGFSAGS